MKFVWVIAIILGFAFGFSVAATFLGALWLGTLIVAFIMAIIMVFSSLISFKFYDLIEWGLWALLLGWILSICL